jgi:hypothetical protein
LAVRGLRASMCRSAKRLKLIPNVRAEAIATVIQKNWWNVGSPPAASTMPR